MKLTVLGCAGSFPGPNAACSAYLVESAGYRLLVDFGTGALGALQRHGDPYALDAIVLTHLHADHIFDACSYVVARRYHPEGALPRIPVYGPAGTRERLMAAYGPFEEPLDDVYEFRALCEDTRRIGPFDVTAERVAHPVETYGLRLTADGRSLAYSSDTGPCEALVRLAHQADVLLCEATFVDGMPNPPNLHLTGREAGEHARKAGVHRLLLTHLVAAWGSDAVARDAAAAVFDGPVEVVRQGAAYQI